MYMCLNGSSSNVQRIVVQHGKCRPIQALRKSRLLAQKAPEHASHSMASTMMRSARKQQQGMILTPGLFANPAALCIDLLQ